MERESQESEGDGNEESNSQEPKAEGLPGGGVGASCSGDATHGRRGPSVSLAAECQVELRTVAASGTWL